MRKIKQLIFLSIGIFGVTNSVHATAPGPYVGLQLGWGDVNQGNFVAHALNTTLQKTFPDATVKSLHIVFTDTGRGGRVFLGHQFNPSFAMEIGYSRFSNLNFSANLNTDMSTLKRYGIKLPIGLVTNIRVITDAFDLVAKGIFPFTDKFSVYGKLGVVALTSMGSAEITLHTPYAEVSLTANPSANLLYPVVGLGMSYDVTRYISADLAVTRIQKVNPCLYPSIDFATVGLMYHFY